MAKKGERKPPAQYEKEAKQVGGCLVHCIKAPRKVYERRRGIVLPSDVFVCHTCDTLGCITDAHHFLGSAADNVADMVNKGRHVGSRGKKCHTTPHTKASKKKMSEAHKRNWNDPKFREEQLKIRTSPELRAKLAKPRPKMSKSAKLLWANKNFREKMRRAKARKNGVKR